MRFAMTNKGSTSSSLCVPYTLRVFVAQLFYPLRLCGSILLPFVFLRALRSLWFNSFVLSASLWFNRRFNFFYIKKNIIPQNITQQPPVRCQLPLSLIKILTQHCCVSFVSKMELSCTDQKTVLSPSYRSSMRDQWEKEIRISLFAVTPFPEQCP